MFRKTIYTAKVAPICHRKSKIIYLAVEGIFKSARSPTTYRRPVCRHALSFPSQLDSFERREVKTIKSPPCRPIDHGQKCDFKSPGSEKFPGTVPVPVRLVSKNEANFWKISLYLVHDRFMDKLRIV